MINEIFFIFFITSIVIPLEQGLRHTLSTPVMKCLCFYSHSIRTRIKTVSAFFCGACIGSFYSHSIRTRIKTRIVLTIKAPTGFYSHSIRTRIKTCTLGYGWSFSYPSIVIPLEQGLRHPEARRLSLRTRLL